MTMVQHVENRIPLETVGTNDTLHEFQIVHAIITQCRKSASADENSPNNNNGCDKQVDNNKNSRTRGSSPKEGRSSFVNTICRTFNALAQATNPSLCAKQNLSSHPVTIASTVKNIISQFGGQNYHGSLCLASPYEQAPVREPPRNSVRRNARIQKAITQSRAMIVQNNAPPKRITPQQPIVVPSTSKLKEPDKNGAAHQKESPSKTPPKKSDRPAQKPDSPAVAPKLKSVRARNANRLTRHVSAPIPHPEEAKTTPKSSASVRRSKSDAMCYRTYHRRQQRKVDSNVQTKVLHFETCCKGKGQAAMCLECRKHNLKEESPATSTAPSTSKIDPAKDKQENYAGALSYHKPSTITQSQKAGDASPCDAVWPARPSTSAAPTKGIPPPTRPKGIACPGGTYFSTTVIAQPTAMEFASSLVGRNPQGVSTNILSGAIPIDGGGAQTSVPFCGLAENLCSQKRKHSASDEEETRCKRESREDATGNADTTSSIGKCNIDQEDYDARASDNRAMSDEDLTLEIPPKPEDGAPHSPLCNNDNEMQENELAQPETVSGVLPLPVVPVRTQDDSGLRLPLSDISSDTSSSCGEADSARQDLNNTETYGACGASLPDLSLSPRQEYLSGTPRASTLRRVPSSRYRRMRRKLKKLISRPKSYPEAQLPSFDIESQEEIMERYLESIRIPAPGFMLRKGTKSSFSARREQLAMRLDSNRNWMSMLPDHIMTQIFSHLDTKSLAMLKCVCKDFEFIVDAYDIRGIDSLWVKDERYIDDPCKFCRKRFTTGDVSMCRYHAKSYHCDLPYGRSYWTCCFQIERTAPGCRTGIHNNHWLAGLSSAE